MANINGGNAPKATGTPWRTMQKLDSYAWKQLRDYAPLQALRWAAAITVVSLRWWLGGTPSSAVAWLPPLALVVLLLLPDADSLGFGAFTWKARKEADRLEAATEQAQKLTVEFSLGAKQGETATAAARTRTEPSEPADQALREFLGPAGPSTGTGGDR